MLAWIFRGKNNINFINITINNKLYNINSVSDKKIPEYYLMDFIIQSVYACETIDQLTDIKCNNKSFYDFINESEA
jgi:hypothetical protein